MVIYNSLFRERYLPIRVSVLHLEDLAKVEHFFAGSLIKQSRWQHLLGSVVPSRTACEEFILAEPAAA